MTTTFTTDMDVATAAASLDCSVKTVYRMLRTGKLSGYRVGAGRGDWRIKQHALELVKRPVDVPHSPARSSTRAKAKARSRLPGWNKFARRAS